MRRLPNPVGCAIGFAAIGCGIGSLVGSCVSPSIWPPLPEGVGTNDEKVMAAYGGLLWGMGLGAVLGFMAGNAYAFGVRWRAGDP